jgi:hypothetical protein
MKKAEISSLYSYSPFLYFHSVINSFLAIAIVGVSNAGYYAGLASHRQYVLYIWEDFTSMFFPEFN